MKKAFVLGLIVGVPLGAGAVVLGVIYVELRDGVAG